MAYEFLPGTAKWAMLDTPDEKYGVYKINVYLDKDGLKQFYDMGTNLSVKQDDEGHYVTFRRDPEKLLEGMSPKPKKLMITGWTDDEEPKPITEPFEGLVGNGSKVIVKVEVYDLKRMKGRGHRLEAVAIETLVPYEGKQSQEDLPF